MDNTRDNSATSSLGNSIKGTISISFVQEALACLYERQIDPTPILQRVGIAPDLLGAPQARISSQHYGHLWHQIAQTLDDEFFGMDSHPMRVGSFTLLCHAIIQSDTLGRALKRALRFLRVVLDDLSGELISDGDTARIVIVEKLGAPPRRAFAYGTFLLLLHGLACWLIGRRIPLSRTDFRCPAPAYSDEWRILFTQDLNFDQTHSGFAFPASYLEMANIQNERTMKAFLREAPANFLVKYKNSTSLAAQIRRRLRELPPAMWPDFNTLAPQLNTSPATLRRRLDDEGQSYRRIMDELRLDMAIMLLGSTSRSIADIATDLGFAETSAFHRAFKKWTGIRPGEYRCAESRSHPPA